MDKRERVMAVYKGQKPDRVPCGFWYHFPEDCAFGDKAVAAHLDFFENSGTDLCKVMNENSCPKDPTINEAADWGTLKPFSSDDSFFARQVELVRRVTGEAREDAVVLATVHGVVASAYHILGGVELYDNDGLILGKHLRENPEGMQHAFRLITNYLKRLCQACLDAGADGIYFASLGGERRMFTDAEFEEFVKPFEIEILNSIGPVPAFNILHMCKSDLNLDRYLEYPAEVLNWGVYEDNISMEEGRALFGKDKIYFGGLEDREGAMVDGSLEDIAQAVRDLISSFGSEKLIVGADCTLPTNLPYERIQAAAHAAQIS